MRVMRTSIVESIRLHPLWTFFGLTFVLSWALWSTLFGITPVNADAAAANPAIFFAILWGGPLVGPALAALLVTAVTAGKGGHDKVGALPSCWR
jgi:hypothetical protein